MRWMGEFLAEQGFSVLGVRLFGHATRPEDMIRARWSDWLASAEDGFNMLQKQTAQVICIGLSMGGALSLLLARDLPVSGVVVMSTPAQSPDARLRRLRPVIPLLSRFWRFAGKDDDSDWHDHEAEQLQVHYGVYPVRATAELNDLLNEMRATLHRVTSPVLLIYAEGDDTTPQVSAQIIHDRLGTGDKEILWLKDSGHNIPRDASRQQAFEAAAAFANRVTA